MGGSRKARVYRNKDVLAFIERHCGLLESTDPETIVRHLCRQIVNDAIGGKYGVPWNGPPFSLEQLASFRGYRVIPERGLISDDAELHPDPSRRGRGTIYLNPDRPPARKGFNVGHELGHTLFDPSYICMRGPTNDKIAEELESLCDIAASELLMPHPHFDLEVGQLGVSVDTLEDLRDRYGASREATAYRMLRCGDQRCAVSVVAFTLKPSERKRDSAGQLFLPGLANSGPKLKLRLQTIVASPAGFPFLPPHKSFPEAENRLLYEAFRNETWPFKGEVVVDLTPRRRFYAEAISLPRALTSHILMLLFDQQ